MLSNRPASRALCFNFFFSRTKKNQKKKTKRQARLRKEKRRKRKKRRRRRRKKMIRRRKLLRSRETKKGPKACSWRRMRKKNLRTKSRILQVKSRGIHGSHGSSTRTMTVCLKLPRICLIPRRWAGMKKPSLSTAWCRNPPAASGSWTQSPQCLGHSLSTLRAWLEKRALFNSLFPEFLLSCFF